MISLGGLCHDSGLMEKEEIHGYLYILIGSTLWGISSVVAKSLFNIGLPPAELVFIRLTLATLTLLLILLFFDQQFSVKINRMGDLASEG